MSEQTASSVTDAVRGTVCAFFGDSENAMLTWGTRTGAIVRATASGLVFLLFVASLLSACVSYTYLCMIAIIGCFLAALRSVTFVSCNLTGISVRRVLSKPHYFAFEEIESAKATATTLRVSTRNGLALAMHWPLVDWPRG